MKTTPTETDREAARLFAPAGGMRAGWRGEKNGARPVWERLRDGSEATPDFYDVDDGPTQGAMLAQVEAAAGAPVELWHCPDVRLTLRMLCSFATHPSRHSAAQPAAPRWSRP